MWRFLHYNQEGERNKSKQNGKEDISLSLCIDDTIIYVKNLKESANKVLALKVNLVRCRSTKLM
jgi:hypothetical protein